MNQLSGFARGTLNASKDSISGIASRTQSWTLDAVGNSSSVITDGGNQTRTHNQQNEVTMVASNTLTFDANGNTTTDETGRQFTYDAWNRLVSATNGTTTVAYAYDALRRRAIEASSGTTTHLYYNAEWQVVEERVGSTSAGSMRTQNVWSSAALDTLVERDRDTNADGTTDERLYELQDGNSNASALVSASGTVIERYVQDPYGEVTVLTASWGPTGGTAYAWQYYHQGLRLDTIDGLYDNRARVYSPGLMRFLQMDPLGIAGDVQNFYRYEANSPAVQFDPMGLTPVLKRFDLAEKDWKVRGPTDRVRLTSLKEIADYLDQHLAKGDCISHLQIGAHGGAGFMGRTDDDTSVLQAGFIERGKRYERDPKNFEGNRQDFENLRALERIKAHMCKEGKIEFIGCSTFKSTDAMGRKIMRELESIFGQGNVIGYGESMVWSPDGRALTEDEAFPIYTFFFKDLPWFLTHQSPCWKGAPPRK